MNFWDCVSTLCSKSYLHASQANVVNCEIRVELLWHLGCLITQSIYTYLHLFTSNTIESF